MKLEKLLYIWIVNNLADKDSYTVNSYTLFAGLYESNKKLKRIQHVRSFLSEKKKTVTRKEYCWKVFTKLMTSNGTSGQRATSELVTNVLTTLCRLQLKRPNKFSSNNITTEKMTLFHEFFSSF